MPILKKVNRAKLSITQYERKVLVIGLNWYVDQCLYEENEIKEVKKLIKRLEEL